MATGKIFEDLAIGEEAAITRVATPDDLIVFAHVSGNLNPLNLPGSPGEAGPAGGHPAPSMWLGSLFSAVLGNLLPGPGTLYVGQTLRFGARAHIGDTLSVRVSVKEKRPPRTVILRTRLLRGEEVLVDGEAEVLAPETRIPLPESALPGILVARHRHLERLLAASEALPPLATAVVAPEEENALGGALAGMRARLIEPLLIGDEAKIRAVATAHNLSLDGARIENTASDDAAAARAVELVHEGRVAAIMKGHLHTDTLLRHVVKSQGGLRGTRRISHVFVMDAPALAQLVLVTDAAINIAPGLKEKVDIVQNAIDLALALGITQPRVGILSAVETVNPDMPSTLDAAALSKMADRGQIHGGIVDGPLAMDNAISLTAARTKGLTSLVAGRSDVLVVPNLEAGNILAKQLTYASQAEGAGLVLGASVPVMLSSRADDETSRLFSCAVAVLYAHWQATGKSAVPPMPQVVGAESL
jgi:phosphotransacetylase/acyl dehydratase